MRNNLKLDALIFMGERNKSEESSLGVKINEKGQPDILVDLVKVRTSALFTLLVNRTFNNQGLQNLSFDAPDRRSPPAAQNSASSPNAYRSGHECPGNPHK